MYFTPYDLEDLDIKRAMKVDNRDILDEFVKSGLVCAKVNISHWSNADSARQSLRASINRFHMDSINVITRSNEVFFINKALVKE